MHEASPNQKVLSIQPDLFSEPVPKVCLNAVPCFGCLYTFRHVSLSDPLRSPLAHTVGCLVVNVFHVIVRSCVSFEGIRCGPYDGGCLQVRSRLESPDHWITYCEVTEGTVSDSNKLTEVHRRKVANYY